MITRTPRFLRAAPAALVCVIGLSITSFAAAVKRTFDIPAGEALPALKQFAKQSSEQLLYSAEAVTGVATKAVNGYLTPREALDRMVEGTELKVVSDRTNGALSLVRVPDPNAPRRPQSDEVPARVEDGKVILNKFEVFGLKSINADLPRTRDDVQPYVVFGRDQIEQSNATNLDEFFRTRLPMNNSGAGTPLRNQGSYSYSSVNLRGLGVNQTLILVDGRRIPSLNVGPAGNGTAQGDVNGIPLSMIERIEILPSTASGIYGGGATGGVINIITKKDYTGIETTLSYGNTFDTDTSTRRIDLNGSLSLQGGRTFLTFSSSFSDGTSLLVQDRDFAQRSRALLLANNPAAIYGPSVTPPQGYTPNIRSQNGSNLMLKSGTALNSPYTHVPTGYTGVASDGGAALVAGAGSYNLALPDSQLVGGLTGALSTPSIRSWSVGGRRRFGTKVEAYVDVSSLENIGSFPMVFASPTSVTLPVSAPDNPFTTPIVVAYPITNLSYLSRQENDSDRIAAGVVARLPRDWNIGVDLTWTRARYLILTPSNMVGDPDGAGPLPSYSTALVAGTLDVVRDLNVHPLNYTPYLMPEQVQRYDYGTIGKEGTLRAAGPLWQLPSGPLTMALSVDWRREGQPSVILKSVSSVPSTFSWYPRTAVDQGAAYLETHVPVFSEKNTSFLRALEFQGSVRYDTYRSMCRPDTSTITVSGPNDPGPGSFTYLIRKLHDYSSMAGFKYSPVRDISFRVSWGTGFLPPSLNQLGSFLSFASTGVNLMDPKRGGGLASTGPITLNQGGNPSLDPELSRSLSAGILYAPRFMSGLRLSVDVTQIDKRNEITTLSPQQDLDYEGQIPWRVLRAPLTAADQALGYTGGRILALSTQFINLAKRRLLAYDFQLDYERKIGALGSFHPYVVATYQPQFSLQILPNTPLVNQVGFTGPLRWRGNAGLDWKRGRWSAGWNLQYYDSYLGYSATGSAAAIASLILNNGTAKVPSQVYHDVYGGYEFGYATGRWQRFLNYTRVTVGVQDIFNTEPPILASASTTTSYSAYGDPRLARYTITLRKRF
ncbi:MAG: TonB-dependent receptor [Opitutaceae bacterium]|nr:TonB-dependent receptor [Opitutaceae bacterium]